MKLLETQNSDLRDQLKEARLLQYQHLEEPTKPNHIQNNENIPPAASKPLPQSLKQTRSSSIEYPSDENHRELIKQFEEDYPAEDCKTQ